MRRPFVRALAALLVLLVVAGGVLWWRIGSLGVEPVAPGISLLSGVGGNVTVLVTDAGAVVVDSMTFVRQGDAIEERVRALTARREVDLDRFGLTPLWFAPYLNRRFVIGRAFEEASAPRSQP